MRAETRHQLSEDRFRKVTIGAAEATVHWSVEHKSKLIWGAIIAVLVAAAAVGGWYYLSQQEQQASFALGQAIRVLDTAVRPAGMPAQPGVDSFASSKERAGEAHKKFQAIVDKYPHTRSGDFARYFAALTSVDLGDNVSAERDLKSVASSSNRELSSLANMALASVYRSTGKNKDAIAIYRQIVDKPTTSVSKAAAQLELAAAYQGDQQPLEAKKIYEQIQKENPSTPASQMATAKLQSLK